jgi:1-acyl-sn-glycerol-3-phosphate acyltransferase
MRTTFPVRYHRRVLRTLGIKLSISGQPSQERPTLFVSNHISYFDIEILGSLIPGSFVAKREVAKWPVFGILAKLQRTVFIDRQVRSTLTQRDSIVGRLNDRENLILFPEGTSHDGNVILPFRSSLFSAAETMIEGRPIAVQPVTIAYTRLNGMPIGRSMRPYFAWYGDMDLAGHLWTVLGLGNIEVTVQFHAPVTIAEFGSRKRLAAYCERQISEALAAANAGRIELSTERVRSCPATIIDVAHGHQQGAPA